MSRVMGAVDEDDESAVGCLIAVEDPVQCWHEAVVAADSGPGDSSLSEAVSVSVRSRMSMPGRPVGCRGRAARQGDERYAGS